MDLRLPDPDSVAAGLILTLAVGGMARAAGAVSVSGLCAGLALGGAASLGLGGGGLVPMGTFFVLGSLATRWKYAEKSRLGFAEPGGGSRGAGRVLAKGAVGAALAFAAMHPAFDPELVRGAFAGAFAAAAADTLGTEVGQVRGRHAFTLLPPRSARPGTEGAVSAQGTVAGFLGAAVVAAAAAYAGLLPWWTVPGIGLAGTLGSLVESLVTPLLRSAPHRGLLGNLITTASGAALAALASPAGPGP